METIDGREYLTAVELGEAWDFPASYIGYLARLPVNPLPHITALPRYKYLFYLPDCQAWWAGAWKEAKTS